MMETRLRVSIESIEQEFVPSPPYILLTIYLSSTATSKYSCIKAIVYQSPALVASDLVVGNDSSAGSSVRVFEVGTTTVREVGVLAAIFIYVACTAGWKGLCQIKTGNRRTGKSQIESAV